MIGSVEPTTEKLRERRMLRILVWLSGESGEGLLKVLTAIKKSEWKDHLCCHGNVNQQC